jgi:CheY-like chemotaxis protein
LQPKTRSDIFTASEGLDAVALRALGAEDVLRKPADAEDLLAAVRRYATAGPPGP